MCSFLKYALVFVISSSLIGMGEDLKHAPKSNEHSEKDLKSKIDHEDFSKWYQDSFITRENFSKILQPNLLPVLSNLIYDYGWDFNFKEESVQKNDTHLIDKYVTELSNNGKYLASVKDYEPYILRLPCIILRKLKNNKYEQLNKISWSSIRSHNGSIIQILFSDDSKYLASLDHTSLVKIWEIDTKSGPLSLKFELKNDIDRLFKFSSDNLTIFYLSYRVNNVVLKNLKLSDNSSTTILSNLGYSFCMSKDYQYIISLEYESFQKIDLAVKDQRNIYRVKHNINNIFICDKNIIFVMYDRWLNKDLLGVCKVDSCESVKEIDLEKYCVCWVRVAPNKKYLVCLAGLCENKFLLIINLETFEKILIMKVADNVTEFSFTENNLVTISFEGITFYQTSDSKQIELPKVIDDKNITKSYSINMYTVCLVAFVSFIIYNLYHWSLPPSLFELWRTGHPSTQPSLFERSLY